MISGTIITQPEMRFTNGGNALLKFELLVTVGRKQHTFNIVAWDAIAETIAKHDEYFKEGATITIDGYYKNHEWVNRRTGEVHKELQYVVREVIQDA